MSDERLDIYGHIPDDDSYKPLRRQAPTVMRMDEFIKQYPLNGFSIRATCKAMGITTSAYYHWIDRDPEFRDRMNEYRRDLYHEAEAVVRAGLYGDIELDGRDKVQLAIAVLRLAKNSEVNVSTDNTGKITGINVTIV